MARAERKNQVQASVSLTKSVSEALPKQRRRSSVTLCRLTPTRGRPRLYDSDYIPRTAHVLCKEHGFTMKQLARVFGVALITLKTWMQKYEEFNIAVKSGRNRFDSEVVEKALLSRATGYEYEEKQIRNLIDKNGKRRTDTTIFTRYEPPNLKAIAFWLNNRKAERWNNDTKFAT